MRSFCNLGLSSLHRWLLGLNNCPVKLLHSDVPICKTSIYGNIMLGKRRLPNSDAFTIFLFSNFNHLLFLVTCMRLYDPLCPSVCLSVGRSRLAFFVVLRDFKSFQVISSCRVYPQSDTKENIIFPLLEMIIRFWKKFQNELLNQFY